MQVGLFQTKSLGSFREIRAFLGIMDPNILK